RSLSVCELSGIGKRISEEVTGENSARGLARVGWRWQEPASKARMCMVLQVKEDIVLTEEDDGYEDDEVEPNDLEIEEVALEDD
ncbi:hypothetical protein CUMW_255110, partial [Citrus unshiu]